MMPVELQPRFFRPYVTSSSTVQSVSSFDDVNKVAYSHHSYANPISQEDAPSPSVKSRFSPSIFAHNSRIAISLLPCAAFLLDLGGTPVVATLIVGLMVAYILDSLNLKPAAFFAVWLSLLFAQIAFFFSHSLISTFHSIALAVLGSFLCAHTNFLVGVWVSLQFKWIQLENPSIILALERLLFASVPFAASSIFTWATISAVGITNASSYYLMAFTCLFYWIYSLPQLSYFKTNKAYFALTSLHNIWEEIWHGNAGWGLQIGGPDWLFSVKNLALLILVFPSHILFNRYVWSYAKQMDSTPLLAMPLKSALPYNG